MTYGYARVSTVGQAKDGNSLEAQEALLSGCDKIYKDSFTGFSRHRPALDELMSVLREGDTLVVTKLDRIARSTQEGLSLVNELIERGVYVNVLNMGLMDNSPNGKLIRTIFFAFAEFERDMIVSRTREGKDIARLKEGYKEGRPFKEVSFKEYYSKWLRGEKTVSECCSILGISRGTWYNRVKLS